MFGLTVCVRVRVCACARTRVRACVCACVYLLNILKYSLTHHRQTDRLSELFHILMIVSFIFILASTVSKSFGWTETMMEDMVDLIITSDKFKKISHI